MEMYLMTSEHMIASTDLRLFWKKSDLSVIEEMKDTAHSEAMK